MMRQSEQIQKDGKNLKRLEFLCYRLKGGVYVVKKNTDWESVFKDFQELVRTTAKP